MLKRLSLIIALLFVLAPFCMAQNTNSNAPQTRRRTTTTTTTTNSNRGQTNANSNTQAEANARKPAPAKASAKDPTARGVLAAFESLLEGIRHADVDAVTAAYWNSPQLVLFNNNGTVTRGWQQLHDNRANSYPNMKDVKLDVRDLRVQMLGRDGALLTCLWTQSQVYKGTPETAAGRMTIIFRRVGNDWKAIHLHTSPDAPEPTRLPPSEQPTPQTQKPKATP
ncbi:MAG TPA: nuclear transport factor 2 family protein [Pyrinomonadaceae bacterium]|jgi:ketosteroid isomerase-like protein|nr:nuclear transport factor 2 family protein [Pyrinomonadaceae bacterium]